MNRRNKEFADEVCDLLLTIRGLADMEARKKHISPYDVEVEVEHALKIHMTIRMIATDMCARRHFDNLKNRELFIFCGDRDCEKIKLNSKWADQDVDLVINRVRLPKNAVP